VAVLWERLGGLLAPLNTFPSVIDVEEWLRLAVASSSVIDLVGAKCFSGPFCLQKLIMHCWM